MQTFWNPWLTTGIAAKVKGLLAADKDKEKKTAA